MKMVQLILMMLLLLLGAAAANQAPAANAGTDQYHNFTHQFYDSLSGTGSTDA